MRVLRLALALAALSAAPAAAVAAPAERLTVARAVPADCTDRTHHGPGTASRAFRARSGGYLTARLHAARGDWDLAVFRRGRAEPVAASAYRGAREVASGYVRRGQRLVLRACRSSGGARTARVRVRIQRLGPAARERVTLVRVATQSAAQRRRLERMGLDLAGPASAGSATVLLHGRDDGRHLRAAGLSYRRVRQPARTAVRVRAAALPSGRSSTIYRRLADYGNEMKALADANPDIVKPITLPLRSHLGRPVEGLEITTNPNARDGKPVYLQLGMHHAREWPAAELPLEWAYELVNAYRAGDARTRSLMDSVRTIIVPVVNPDGFNFSREAGQAAGHGGGHTGFDGTSAEYHRKNCTPSGCFVNLGVDPNRNYGDRWGGDGTTAVVTAENYRGTAPFSEPEVENIRRLISTRQVVMMITNHTFGNEILRQPGDSDEFPAPDEPLLASVGADMAAENGYGNILSYQIGDHVGTTDGWSYYTTGGLGYVFEIHPNAFHAPYADVVQHYDGSLVPGGGNREAYYVAMESAANAAHHAVLRGVAPPGAILRLTKTFQNRVELGSPTNERFDTTMEVPASGRFEWHVNQSSRPLVPGETWALTCERPEGTAQTGQSLAVARGQALELDLSACGSFPTPTPTPTPGTRHDADLSARFRARFNGRFYRARVSGAIQNLDPGPAARNCAGLVSVAIRARGKKVAGGRITVDATCRFARTLRFRPRALPRALRRRGARIRLTAGVRWSGNSSVLPERLGLSARVRRG